MGTLWSRNDSNYPSTMRRMILIAFLQAQNCTYHVCSWRHPLCRYARAGGARSTHDSCSSVLAGTQSGSSGAWSKDSWNHSCSTMCPSFETLALMVRRPASSFEMLASLAPQDEAGPRTTLAPQDEGPHAEERTEVRVSKHGFRARHSEGAPE